MRGIAIIVKGLKHREEKIVEREAKDVFKDKLMIQPVPTGYEEGYTSNLIVKIKDYSKQKEELPVVLIIWKSHEEYDNRLNDYDCFIYGREELIMEERETGEIKEEYSVEDVTIKPYTSDIINESLRRVYEYWQESEMNKRYVTYWNNISSEDEEEKADRELWREEMREDEEEEFESEFEDTGFGRWNIKFER